MIVSKAFGKSRKQTLEWLSLFKERYALVKKQFAGSSAEKSFLNQNWKSFKRLKESRYETIFSKFLIDFSTNFQARVLENLRLSNNIWHLVLGKC